MSVADASESSPSGLQRDDDASAQPSSDDINNVFEDVFMLEERFINIGYKLGLEDSKHEEEINKSYDTGYKIGLSVGHEVGFYYGVVCGVTEAQLTSNPKAADLLKQVKTLIEKYPRYQDPEEDLLHLLQQIRNKYRLLCAQLKHTVKYPRPNDLSF